MCLDFVIRGGASMRGTCDVLPWYQYHVKIRDNRILVHAPLLSHPHQQQFYLSWLALAPSKWSMPTPQNKSVTINYKLSWCSVVNGRFFAVIAFFGAITYYVVGHGIINTHFEMTHFSEKK